MKYTIENETHGEALFQIYDKPKEYVHGGNYGTLVHNEKNAIDKNGKMVFVVNIFAKLLIENVQALCVINTVSVYELDIPLIQMIPMDLWKPLVIKSVEECNNIYLKKVKGTYLEGTDIPMPTAQELGM